MGTDHTMGSGLYTHYYKIAHAKLISYGIYTLKKPSTDQVLLELELQIRHNHPRILLTYYNKRLYHFRFAHWGQLESSLDSQNDGSLRLDELHPDLDLNYENTVLVEQLANPSRASKKPQGSAGQTSPETVSDELLAFASLSFLKAVKKTLVYNLAGLNDVQLFGSYVVARVPNSSCQYFVLQIDPILLGNGDLIVSLTQRNRLPLFHSSVLNLDHVFLELASCFVIYVIPSALRCHLYDSTSFLQSFTRNPPKASSNLLRLLKLSTRVDLTEKDLILWVKLIPNLQHLNNQTSSISRFIHDVENKKYILWPWELCVLQFGSVEQQTALTEQNPGVDPLALISDFIQFNIDKHDSEGLGRSDSNKDAGSAAAISDSATYTYNFDTVPSSGRSNGAPELKMEALQPPLIDHKPSVAEIFELQDDENEIRGPESSQPKRDEDQHPEAFENENSNSLINEDDDLFGDSPTLETKDSLQESQLPKQEPMLSEKLVSDHSNFIEEDTKMDQIDSEMEIADAVKANNDFQLSTKKQIYLGIPRSEMISLALKVATPASYKDPGAPLPVMPTPVIPQLQTMNAQAGQSAPSQKPHVTSNKDASRFENAPGYSFSPIAFNPRIKSSIDKKYGRGGKFFVDREESAEPEIRKPRLRETSVLAYEQPAFSEADKSFGQESNADDYLKLSRTGGLDPFGTVFFAESEKEPTQQPEDLEVDEEVDDEIDDEDEEDDEEEEEYESDEDEDDLESQFKKSPLRLNTHLSDIFNNNDSTMEVVRNHRPLTKSSSHLSPRNLDMKNSASKDASPIGLGVAVPEQTAGLFAPTPHGEPKGSSAQESPLNEDHPLQIAAQMENARDELVSDSVNTPASNESSSSGVSESSNCLPLILRSINVFSIPNSFMLRSVPGAWGNVSMSNGFIMDVDEEEDDLFCKPNDLAVKSSNMDEFLSWLMPHLAFDCGLNSFDRKCELKLPDFHIEEVSGDMTDGSCSEDTAKLFLSAFPLSYKIHLDEFMKQGDMDDTKTLDSEMKSQLSFLDEISNVPLADSSQSERDSTQVYWDSIFPDLSMNRDNFATYCDVRRKASDTVNDHSYDEDNYFSLNGVKAKALKNGHDLINLNYAGLKFWNYLNFSPVNGPKHFQVLLIAECSPASLQNGVFNNKTLGFLDLLQNNYKDSRFGTAKKLDLMEWETRPDLKGIKDGLMLVEKDGTDRSHNDYYRNLNRKLGNLAELIKVDLINRTNKFQFDKPLLLLFIDADNSISSTLQISKICRNFKLALRQLKLSLVEVFSHIIPSNRILKGHGERQCLKYISDSALTKISMLLYNKCPNSELHDHKLGPNHARNSRTLYTQLVEEPPTTLQFKFLNRASKEGTNTAHYDDLFLHVAYERSVDKNWISAAWSDPLGIVTHLKSWFCTTDQKFKQQQEGSDLGTVIAGIWETSNMLFSRLINNNLLRTGGAGKKKFLVLTRISSIIPDDELVFWKRLTAKFKDVSLIVLSTNRLPKLLFLTQLPSNANETKDERSFLSPPMNNTNGHSDYEEKLSNHEFLKNLAGYGGLATSPANLAVSPGNQLSMSMASPPQPMFNGGASYLSPLDAPYDVSTSAPDSKVTDPNYEITGIVPKTSLPSFNSPTRLGMRIGYLVRESQTAEKDSEKKFMVFEVTLLSCSAYWNLNAIMKILLNQYKKLIVLNDVLGTNDQENLSRAKASREHELWALVPWHINAVVKTLNYLVHVHVEP